MISSTRDLALCECSSILQIRTSVCGVRTRVAQKMRACACHCPSQWTSPVLDRACEPSGSDWRPERAVGRPRSEAVGPKLHRSSSALCGVALVEATRPERRSSWMQRPMRESATQSGVPAMTLLAVTVKKGLSNFCFFVSRLTQSPLASRYLIPLSAQCAPRKRGLDILLVLYLGLAPLLQSKGYQRTPAGRAVLVLCLAYLVVRI